MATFVYACLNCGLALDGNSSLTKCPMCGGRHISIGVDADSSGDNPFANPIRGDFEKALENGRLSYARSLLPQLIKLGNQGPEQMFNQLLLAYSAEYMRNNEKSLKEALRQKDITRIGTLIECFKEHDCDVATYEQRYLSLCCSALSAITGFVANPSQDGRAVINLSWDSVLQGAHETYVVVRKIGVSSPKNTNDGEVVFSGISTAYSDEDIVWGRAYSYAIFPCFRGVPNTTIRKFAKVRGVICYGHIVEFNATGSGIESCAVVKLDWTMPTYDSSINLSLVLERVHGNERKKINVALNQGHYVDEDVKVGELYRYELLLTVEGKNMAPVVREVTVTKLPDLPKVEASCYYQDGQYRIHVEWPDDVSEICLSAHGEHQSRYTKADFNARNITLPYDVSLRPITVQAIQEFWQGNLIYGPSEDVKFVDSQRTLFVSIECAKTGIRAVLSIWQGKEWGIRVSCADENGESAPIPSLKVTVINQNDWVNRAFTISAGTIRANEFFKFPSEWGVKRGATIDVSISDGSGHAYIKYLTSQVIS